MRRTVATGLAVVAIFAALAAVSGSLSPLARRPLLDTGPVPVPYRWVAPPPEAVAGNQQPSSGAFQLPISNGTSVPKTFFTSDGQTTLPRRSSCTPCRTTSCGPRTARRGSS